VAYASAGYLLFKPDTTPVARILFATCQENAKSACQYRRCKIREAVEQECASDVLCLPHVLDDPKSTSYAWSWAM
jgi:hypothetical protein